jgi:hypothetical protein
MPESDQGTGRRADDYVEVLPASHGSHLITNLVRVFAAG